MTRTLRFRLHAPFPQSVTFVELFFDLVFVFAVTQLTELTAGDLTAAGVVRSLVVFWLIWWAWTQFTWTLNPADTTHSVVRVITLAATAAAFVMAASVPRAVGEDPLWFVIPYLVVRILGLGLQVRVDLERAHGEGGSIVSWVVVSALGLAIVLAGAVVDPSVRPFVWMAAILVDLFATQAAGRRTWDIHAAHLAERHGLFVIIALGESLILIGTSVAGEVRTPALATVGMLTLIVACLLWWTYFGWLKEAMEERLAAAAPSDVGRLARDAYSLGHFPMVFGIVAFAVAIEEIVAHPDEPLGAAVTAALGAGIGLFIGFSVVAYWLSSRRILVRRLVILPVMAGVLLLVVDMSPVWALFVVAAALLVVVLLEALVPEAETGPVEAPKA
jgi:low temperature requirement protein LtrA